MQNKNVVLVNKAKQIIERIFYITIASVSKDSQPWNSPVYCAYDENYNFYWASWRENQHSKNIHYNPNVFLVIYDSTVPAGTGEGVYMQAKAYELHDEKGIMGGVKYLYGRENRPPRLISHFMGEFPRRIYKAIPQKIWMNTEGKINGNYVDTRIEVDLLQK